ncbi:Quinone oxidoreductase 1 [Planctomycetes bacterium LzC2]|uniref:Quinone oxidoreductase 1 n=1 Tax=Alienimonas chondri TaxID=2681879 RepID=A0ABX1VCS3_9PLAN|nr:Quinone oxidoreductase 1 [Alienimonas chondri]
MLQVRERPDPGEPGENEVRVKVGAVGVNPIDTYVRSGAVSAGPRASEERPRVIGCDWAGTVEAVGAGVTKLAVGDRVWGVSRGISRDGSAAEVICEPAEQCFPVPPKGALLNAAACGLAAVTAHLGLFRTGALGEIGSGDEESSVFVQGGSGGVGSIAIELARRAGYRVATTAGSDEKRQECLRRGAEEAFDYRDPELIPRLNRFDPGGFEVWLETHRDPNVPNAMSLMRVGGRIVLLAGRDAVLTVPLGQLYPRDLSLRGFAMFNASPAELQTATAGVAGIEPLIARTYPLSEIARAHADLEAGDTGDRGGKLVIEL